MNEVGVYKTEDLYIQLYYFKKLNSRCTNIFFLLFCLLLSVSSFLLITFKTFFL
ncbi:hypothetical protein C0J52_11063 [Blattella germanica]|nr:hypothetical protein C0J52_11063 [Blattella germanica]